MNSDGNNAIPSCKILNLIMCLFHIRRISAALLFVQEPYFLIIRSSKQRISISFFNISAINQHCNLTQHCFYCCRFQTTQFFQRIARIYKDIRIDFSKFRQQTLQGFCLIHRLSACNRKSIHFMLICDLINQLRKRIAVDFVFFSFFPKFRIAAPGTCSVTSAKPYSNALSRSQCFYRIKNPRYIHFSFNTK